MYKPVGQVCNNSSGDPPPCLEPSFSMPCSIPHRLRVAILYENRSILPRGDRWALLFLIH